MDLTKVRNFGISAHIDSGKTTLSERILFYTGRIHKIEEVKGGGDGATMDYMDLEKERGITITSAATTVQWDGLTMNLIDTPGHVDFTVEVERSLRVLDGAILVLCAVGGVQSQSMTVDRQMKRYRIPRLAFINKMDRTGARPFAIVDDVKAKLGVDACLMQYPMGGGETFAGMIDLTTQKALYFDGRDGENVREEAVPAEYAAEVKKYRQIMLETLAMYSDEMMALLLSEEEVPLDLIYSVTKHAVQQQGFTPVFVGSAYKNKGVQPLLDAIVRFLPCPLEREVKAKNWEKADEAFPLFPDSTKPFVGMAFKIVEDPFGQLTFMRLYQGKITKGEMYYNQRTGKKDRFSRIVKMHADKREEIDVAEAGDIVAIMGIDCASGDTYAAEPKFCTLESMFIAKPVIKVAVTPVNRADSDKLSKALQRFRKEDPTFNVFNDEETSETIIAGMGELHLDIYVERIKREYKVELQVGAPKVSYRESPTQKYEFNYKHRKQSGGSGQYAHIVGFFEPLPEDSEENFIFEENIVGGRIPKNFIPSIEKGFKTVVGKGPLAEYPVVGLKAVVNDGSYHEVDSSDRAFQTCAEGCFREHFKDTKPAILEPIMKVEIECPENFQGPITGDLISRRGMIVNTDSRDKITNIVAEVPLAETFGYATDIRSMSQGQGTFTMELSCYRKVPGNVQEEIIAEKRKQLAAAAK
ncbi:translation elongation factor G [Pirellula staleyi DSM 6068]|uniref:Elongation factor G n=1 Tax=Pirellula staleyi (strain ATCC 27377 / DSM 6068 / ICPB 4128) TaxID=530564 RepID=D2QZV7_PIRSD|nr:elongation factor G [Pirellula staleyi]ADB16590.1 translation elongation factor G [Pirellula staleyi DSM 6068]